MAEDLKINVENKDTGKKKTVRIDKKTLFLVKTALNAAVCITCYKMGADAIKRKVGVNISAMVLADPTLKDHMIEAMKKAKDVLEITK